MRRKNNAYAGIGVRNSGRRVMEKMVDIHRLAEQGLVRAKRQVFLSYKLEGGNSLLYVAVR